MTRDRIKYAVCQSCGILEGQPHYPAAHLTADIAMDSYPIPLHVVTEAAHYSGDLRKWEKQLRKQRKREEDALYDAVAPKVFSAIRANPETYGFAGILGFGFLLFQIGGIVWPIIRALFDMRYNGKDGEVQAACGRVP